MKHRHIIHSGRGAIWYFVGSFLFCGALLFFEPLMGIIGVALLTILLVIQIRTAAKHRRELTRYIEDISRNAGAAAGSAMSAPLPTVVIRLDTGEIVWHNKPFAEIAGQDGHLLESRLAEVAPTLSLGWLIAGRTESPELIQVGERWFEVCGTTERVDESKDLLATLYFIDRSSEHSLREINNRIRPVVGIFMFDNYDELTKDLSEQQKSSLMAELDDKLVAWLNGADCLLRKYEKTRYVIVCEQSLLDRCIADKFSVLDAIRATGPADNPPTLSIGFGAGGKGYGELFEFASLAIDMALSRGGDQAVIKDRTNFTFFGGKAPELANRTKVKSRVMANVLRRLIASSSGVYIMGHKNSDFDSIGAAAGMVCICRRLGREAHVIVDMNATAAAPLISRLSNLPEYSGVFISPQDAMVHIDSSSLLVVVDTNRPEVVESIDILESCSNVAVVDHHRRAASYISNAALNMHEPYASSASELVCELLGYIEGNARLLKTEAEALLAGIALDTKNFTMRAGVRTFEAAATLRLAGADTVEVKKLFQTSYDDYLECYRIISHAENYRGRFSIAAVEHPAGRIVAAQAADALLGVDGVQASFVVVPEGNRAIISARSLGQVNVQVIVEKLGGGGHMAMAGAQLDGVTPQEAARRIRAAIDETAG